MRRPLTSLLALACTSVPVTARAAEPLDPGVVRGALHRVEAALEQAYAGRIFRTPETWASVHGELARLAEQPLDAPSLCAKLGDALAGLHDPSVFVFDERGRCVSSPHFERAVAPFPTEPNVAAGERRAFALSVRRTPDVAVLGVRAFEPLGEAWNGFDAASEAVAKAPAAVIDLRDARGDDPRGALPLLRALTGRRTFTPLRELVVPRGPLVDSILDAGRALPFAGARTPEPWQQLIGDEPDAGAVRAPRPLDVLVGGPCETACELLARALQTYAGAEVHGQVGTDRRLATDAIGVLELGVGQLRVALPTAAYRLQPAFEQLGGVPGTWFLAGRTQQPPGTRALERLVARAQARLRWAAEEQRWIDRAPPPCASFAPARSWQRLPANARGRIFAALPKTPERVTISATLTLPANAAIAYVDGCPGLRAVASTPYGQGGSTTVTIAADSYAALTRLAQSPAVSTIRWAHDVPYEVDPE